MNDLVGFLRARLDEDEQVARSASDWEDDPTPWALLGSTGGYCEPALHVHRRRLLAEVDAKRAFIEDTDYVMRSYENDNAPDTYGGVYACEQMLKRLASVYADHPDYREEWRP